MLKLCLTVGRVRQARQDVAQLGISHIQRRFKRPPRAIYLREGLARHERQVLPVQQHALDQRANDMAALPNIVYERTKKTMSSFMAPTLIFHFTNDYIKLAYNPDSIKLHPVNESGFKALMEHHQQKGVLPEHIWALYFLLRHDYSEHRMYIELSIHLLRNMSANGDPEATATLLYGQLYAARMEMKARLPKNPLLAGVREDLGRLIKHTKGAMFELLVLEAMMLQTEGDIAGAVVMYNRAMPDAVEASRKTLPSQVFINAASQVTICDELLTPWDHLLPIYNERRLQARTAAAQADISRKIADLVQKGVQADAALAHYYAAGLADHAYRQEQQEQREEGRQEDGVRRDIERPARRPEAIGTPSTWLYHMTKAAASGLPDAATELGQFYWKTRWRFLDDEPLAHTKPTPLDRYPVPKITRNVYTRLLRAVGLSTPESGPQDMFKTVGQPGSLSQRVELAYDWTTCAVNIGYLPALRTMIEITSTKNVHKDIASNDKAMSLSPERYSYTDRVGYVDALLHGTDDGLRPTLNESAFVANPKYDDEVAIMSIHAATRALQIHRIWLQFQRSADAFWRSQGFYDYVMWLSRSSKDEPYQEACSFWLRFPDVFDLWKDDAEMCEELLTYMKDLCAERGWEFDPAGMLA